MKSNPVVFAAWISRYTVLYSTTKWAIWCAMNNADRQKFLDCIAAIPPESLPGYNQTIKRRISID